MSNVSERDRQEIVQATLEKTFKKLAKKGVIPQEKVANLSNDLLEARSALIQEEIRRLQTEHQQILTQQRNLSRQ